MNSEEVNIREGHNTTTMNWKGLGRNQSLSRHSRWQNDEKRNRHLPNTTTADITRSLDPHETLEYVNEECSTYVTTTPLLRWYLWACKGGSGRKQENNAWRGAS